MALQWSCLLSCLPVAFSAWWSLTRHACLCPPLPSLPLTLSLWMEQRIIRGDAAGNGGIENSVVASAADAVWGKKSVLDAK
jgi:hypothetical protein